MFQVSNHRVKFALGREHTFDSNIVFVTPSQARLNITSIKHQSRPNWMQLPTCPHTVRGTQAVSDAPASSNLSLPT